MDRIKEKYNGGAKKMKKAVAMIAVLLLILSYGVMIPPKDGVPAAKALTYSWNSDYGTVTVGESKEIEAILDKGSTDYTIEWTTPNSDLISLSGTDEEVVTITGIKPGKATFIYHFRGYKPSWDGTMEYNDATGYYTITVVEKPKAPPSSGSESPSGTGSSSSRDNAQDMGTRTMNVGQSIALTHPNGTSGMSFHSYNWESGNSSIASASSGINNRISTITALKPGTVTIYGFLMGSLPQTKFGSRYNSITKRWESYSYQTYFSVEYNYKWTINVQGAAASPGTSTTSTTVTVSNGTGAAKTSTLGISPKLSVKKSVKLKRGRTVKLKVTRKGSGTLTYKSGNQKIATVSSLGKIRGRKKGTTTITVKVKAKGKYKSASKKVKVTVR